MKWAVAAAVACTLGATQQARAQDTTHTRPDSVRRTAQPARRIPIVKESPGEVVPPPAPAPVPIPAPPPPPPVEAPAVLPPPPPPPPPLPVAVRRPLGLFGTLGGGLALGSGHSADQTVGLGVECIPGPNGDPETNHSRLGYNVTGALGWMPITSPIGVRVGFGYTKYSEHGDWLATDGTTGSYETHPQIMSGSADLKVRLGWLTNRLSPYAIGGVSVNRYRNELEETGSTPIDSRFDNQWHTGMGYNAGAGLEYMFGRTGLFVESRYVHVNGANDAGVPSSSFNHVPVIVGLTWY